MHFDRFSDAWDQAGMIISTKRPWYYVSLETQASTRCR